MYFVYVLQSKINSSFYKGHTENLERRLFQHNNKQEKSTARYAPWTLVWFCSKPSKKEAMGLEFKLKNLSTDRLIEFIIKYPSEKLVCGPDVALLRKSGC